MTPATVQRDAEVPFGLPVHFRPRDASAHGVSRARLRTWLRTGRAVKVERGLYRLAGREPTELETVAQVCALVPKGVVCLLGALRFHEIGTESPREVWIAIARRSRRPRTGKLPVRFFRFSPRFMHYGVDDHDVDGVRIRVTSPARTVVDCFRYRNKIGLSVALEALDDALRTRRATVAAILRAAEVGRMANVLRPYLEARTR